MDQWALINKLVLIFFIALNFVYKETVDIPWAVFLLLTYFCLNICLHLLKQRYQVGLLLLSIALSIIGSVNVSPLFMLLLPLSFVELTNVWTKQKVIPFLLAVIPVAYVDQSIQAVYVLVAIYTFLTYTMGRFYHLRLMKNEDQLDAMRITQQKLMKQINDNDAFMKQSAYMFKLEERNRISQEIHDDIGHSIAGALIQMEAAKRMMSLNPEKAKELLQNAIGITQEGIDSIRFTLKNMKPTTEQVGVNRLKLSIDEFITKHDKHTALTCKGNMDRITHIQWKVIHDNVTEALTNSLKYAERSTQIAIDVNVLNKLIRVEVKDNGNGAVKVEKGLGIIGMEERTAAIDGKIIIDGTDGFSVTTLLPIQH
ncbi:histidine kinase [Virgibacillus phasianinus]|uniref:histidine kinase n=1 Tax=Virgibacillus phasianinus TaxID=2017483 RepID=A0A220TYG6_9BACI|nr:histidine kinase [Virgibacillus phasianinus]ASK60713.1 histidine kinase [Virgibacillus phasianinus]